jgi:hypothetical protein
MAKIDVDHLQSEMDKILKEYSGEVIGGIKVSAEEAGKEAVKHLRKTSPKRKKGGGAYAKSWKLVKSFNRLGIGSVTVFNEKHWRLTHLLENGHYSRSGKWVSAQPHIAPAEEMAIKSFEEKVKEFV